MHIQTHVLSGWCIANLVSLNSRQRLAAMVAAAGADFDGLGILFGQEAYWKYHHVVGHNLLFGILLSFALVRISSSRIRVFWVFLGLFHLHLIMDFFGSGPGWPIAYFWPLSWHSWDNRRWSWPFYSWQNMSAAAVLVAWTIAIAVRQGRTPLERLMPSLDRQLVAWLRNHIPYRRRQGNERSDDSLRNKRPAASVMQSMD
jgi:hypothetical protein